MDPRSNLIKGGGAAHTREKVIASAAARFVVVADETKLVSRLGEKMPVPVEVIPMAVSPVLRRLRDLGAVPEIRMGIRKDGPVITDQGNFVVDARFARIDDPASLERAINEIPGVLDNGLFVGMVEIGPRRLRRPGRRPPLLASPQRSMRILRVARSPSAEARSQ